MSLLERLGKKPEKEKLMQQLMEEEVANRLDDANLRSSALSSRLQSPMNLREASPEKTIAIPKEKLKSRMEIPHIEVNDKSVEMVDEVKTKVDKNRKNLVENNNTLSINHGLGMKLGLGKRLDLASRLSAQHGERGVGISAQLSSPVIDETLQQSELRAKVLENRNVLQRKINDYQSAESTIDAQIAAKTPPLVERKKNTDDVNVPKDIVVNDGGGLGSKLGMGQRNGLGARLGKTSDSSVWTANQKGRSGLTAKIGGNKIALPEQEQYQNLKIEIHRQIIEELSIEQQKVIANSSSDRSELERIVVELCNRVIDGDNPMAISRADRVNIVNDIVDEVLGLGPIESLLKDESVSEVMINGPKMVYVERKGKLTLTNVHFQDETHLLNIIERIVAPLGRRIDESSPLVDARLADGSRVNVIIPPLALNGACVTIRKFAKDPLTINNLIGFGSLNEDMASLIKSCVLGRLNIVVSGGTGSGKTTTLNVLSSFIPEDERIVTIEDAAELQLRQDHVVTLESRPANVEGNGQVSIRDLVRNSLRMRPDRIVVGECRSGEALDMLQAMNTGHDGSLTTAHANSPRDVISRLETMVLMAGMELPVKAIREQIASAVDLIIQQSRLRDGSRKITYITEVQGMEGDVIVLQDIFRYEQDGLDENGKLKGQFRTLGIRPKFLEKLDNNGIKVNGNMFFDTRGWDE